MPKRTMTLMERARWSDEFFNYVPAEQCWDVKECKFNQERLKEAATTFLEVNTDCPFFADELVQDFIKRV